MECAASVISRMSVWTKLTPLFANCRRRLRMGALAFIDMQEHALDRLLSAAEVSRLLGVSLRTFECLIARGETPPFLTIGRQRRWRPRDVDAWLASLLSRSSTPPPANAADGAAAERGGNMT